MNPKDPSKPPSPSASREERLAKALRDNLARRKALVRAKRERTVGEAGPSGGKGPDGDDDTGP